MQPAVRRGPPRGAKRSQADLQADRETEPKIKRQRPLERFDRYPIDPDGDLLIVFDHFEVVYQIDSRAVRRASPVLYEQCLAVKASDGSYWAFKLEEFSNILKYRTAVEEVLSLIHGNTGHMRRVMDCETVYYAFIFTTQYEMFDRYYVSLLEWYERSVRSTMGKNNREKKHRDIGYCLWLAHELGHEEDLMYLQNWAIFNLCSDDMGGLGDSPVERRSVTSHDLSEFRFPDRIITGRFMAFLEAPNMMLTPLIP